MDVILTTMLLVIIGSLSFLHFWTHYTRTGKLIDKVPGPKSLPIIGNTLDLAVPVEDLWCVFRNYADTYYSIYKFAIGHRPVINLRHPDDLEVLFSSQKYISKSFFYDFLHPWLEKGLLTSTANKWHSRRKVLTPAFHYKMLDEFVGVLVENSEQMVKSLKSYSGEIIIKDLETFIAKYTLNNICETAMGTTLQDNDPVHQKYRQSVKQMGEIIYHRSVRPWLVNDWIFSLTQKGKEQKELLKNLHGFTNKIIKERKAYHEETGGKYLIGVSDDKSTADVGVPIDFGISKKKRLAMLDLLIAEQRERGYIDDRGIREEVDTFVFEGHDTTQMGLCFTLLLLAEHKEIQERARVEIASVMKASNGKLGMKELQSLPYLDRCIKEAQRMYPSVPLVSRKIGEDMQLKKFLIPGGTIIIAHIFDVHRDPNFWPEPHIYDPDRFLPDNMAGRHPFSYVPFSAGPRNCIGQKFAMLELRSVTALLLHNFYLEAITPTSQVRLGCNLVLKSVDPLKIKFVPIR